jgi:Ca-activated chloride channel family protein
VRAAQPGRSSWRRHLPFALFILALVAMTFAVIRPVQIVAVPYGQATIILSLDASGSMRQTDIDPSRLEAAQAAAMSFIQQQKAGTQIGLVAFAGYAEMIQAPTTDQEALQNSVESLTTARGTAIGSGILKSIDAISEIDPNVAPSTNANTAALEPTPVPKGAYAPDIIVLLTDGLATTGPAPLDAAQQAVTRGIRVYTIGFGTENGSPDFGGGFGGGPRGGGGGFGGGGFRRGIDEDTLKKIADMTGGEYYAASSAGELLKVFQNLPTYLITKHEVQEISVIFAGLGALLLALAIGFALRWNALP